MGTYLLSPLPGSAPGDIRRCLGITSLGQPAFLSRACRDTDPGARLLRPLLPGPSSSSLVAGLVEIGEADHWVVVAEAGSAGVPLRALLDRGPLPPDLAAFIALRLAQACASLPSPHLRVSSRNVVIRTNGEPLLLGAGWAALVPPELEDTPFIPERGFTDARADAFGAAELARVAAGADSGWIAFPVEVRTALERAGAGPRRTWMLHPGELAGELEAALGLALASAPARLAALLPSQQESAIATAQSPQLVVVPFPPLVPAVQETALLPEGKALGLDGRIVDARSERAPTKLAVQPVATAPEGAWAPLSSSGLDLDERALAHALGAQQSKSAESQKREALVLRRRRTRRRAALACLLAAAALGVAAVAGFLPTDELARRASSLGLLKGSSEARALLRVESDPPGATLSAAGQVLGETPYIGDNDFPEGSVTLRVEKAGFEPALRQLAGGVPARVRVKLVPKKAAARRP